jgi:Txe/YoeB family toxin of Txe-Axe toxin-antitoxin module
MALKAVVSGDVALAFLGEDIPAIGPMFKNRGDAMKAAQKYLERINELSGNDQNIPFQIVLNKQADGRYSLVVDSSHQMVSTLNNLDELLVMRFRKGLKKKLFILTCFVEGVDGMECLVLTEGLGAVFYAPNAVGIY